MANNTKTHHKPSRPTEETSLLVNLDDIAAPRQYREQEVSINTVKKETFWLFFNGLPISLTSVLQSLTNVTAAICLGHLGSNYLAAGSLGNAFIMLTCTSWLMGMGTALDTLCSQTFTAGSQNSKLLSMHIQRALVVLFACFIPMTVLSYKAESILLLMGQDPEVARLSGQYALWQLLHIPGFIVIDVFRRFLQSQGKIFILIIVLGYENCARILCITGPIGAILSYVFTIVLRDQIGFLGAPLATAISYTIGAIFIVRHSVSLSTWSPWTSAAFSDCMSFIKLAVPGVLMSCNEIWVFEILTVVASYFGPAAVAAQTITLQCSMLSLLIHHGIAVASSNRIGNYLGAGKPVLAQINAWSAFGFIAILASMYGSFIFSFPEIFGSIYTKDQEVIDLVGRLLPIGAFFHVFIALTLSCDGILRGQGRQSYGASIRIITFYAIGLPLAILFTTYLDLHLAGLWLAFLSAVLLTAIFEIVLIARSNWLKLSTASQERVRLEEAKLDISTGSTIDTLAITNASLADSSVV
ncbi:mate-domain-containing protein [Syncephalis fuscata]|nr:mate-domain-containing protein [Syncephalis fuscata]